MDDEVEALKKYGVIVKPGHQDGYTYVATGSMDTQSMQKPWDTPLPEQLGWDQNKVYMCESFEHWFNPGFLVEVRDSIAYLTLNEPENNNSFSPNISNGFADATRILRNRPDIRVAVLTGNGRMWSAGGDPRGFQAAQRTAGVIGPEAVGPPPPASAQLERSYDEARASHDAHARWGREREGEDLLASHHKAAGDAAVLEESYEEYGGSGGDHELYGGPPGFMIVHNEHIVSGKQQNLQQAMESGSMFYRWATIPQFSIACMNGSAMGGALGLLAGSDFVVAVRSAFAVLSEVRLGVIPAVVSPHVIRAVGTSNAKRIFATAENLNMAKAVDIGLVQRIVNKKDEFPAVVKEIAEKVQAVSPQALASTKASIFACLNQPMSNSLLEYASREYARVRLSEECQAGMKALVENKAMPWEEKKIDAKE